MKNIKTLCKLRNKLVVLLTKNKTLTKQEVEAIELSIQMYDNIIDNLK